MTDIAQQQQISQLQENINSLQIDNAALENSYMEEIKKSHQLKRQIFSLSQDIEKLKNKIIEIESKQEQNKNDGNEKGDNK